jgi:PPOX class probable F420-dependent enzyme
MLDPTTEFGVRVARRLREEMLIWLTTVRADRTPQPSPVWFLWDGQTFLIFSQPNKPKLRNIAANPNVALNLESNGGGDVVILGGEAAIVGDAPQEQEIAAYVAKYREDIAGLGQTPEGFAKEYSVAVRVRPARVRGF